MGAAVVADGRYRVRTGSGQIFVWTGDWPATVDLVDEAGTGPGTSVWLDCEGDAYVQLAHVESVELLVPIPLQQQGKS